MSDLTATHVLAGSSSRVDHTASDVLAGSNSRVEAGSISRVTMPHLTCDEHVSCGCRGDIKQDLSAEIQTSQVDFAGATGQPEQHLVPRRTARDEKGGTVTVHSQKQERLPHEN